MMKRVITSVVRISTHSSSGFQHAKPLRIVSLCGCVHHIVSDEPVGELVECEQCGDVEAAVARAKEFMSSPLFSHITERSTAMNGDRSWESLMFYRYDATSPTKCILEFSLPSCDEVRAAIAECKKSSLPGPSRGQFAKL